MAEFMVAFFAGVFVDWHGFLEDLDRLDILEVMDLQ
jgi:hypothetical protein